MAHIVRLRPWHLRLIELQDEQASAAGQLTEAHGEWFLMHGDAWACVDRERVYAAAGLFYDEGKVMGWALLGKDAGRHLALITKKAREVLKDVEHVQIYVRSGHAEGARWARMLGLALLSDQGTTSPRGETVDLWGR